MRFGANIGKPYFDQTKKKKPVPVPTPVVEPKPTPKVEPVKSEVKPEEKK